MKKYFITGLISLIATSLSAQENNDKTKDTVRIILGGESISLPMPKEGNKVTVNLEDSAEIIQISIGKISKTAALNVPKKADGRFSQEPESTRKISWFREIELGTLGMLSGNRELSSDSAIGTYINAFSPSDNSTSMVKIKAEKVYPGFTFGINIKEKSRPFKNSNLNFITGFRFRYSNYITTGEYEVVEFKSHTINGAYRYYPDSILSQRNGNYRASTNYYHVLFPFLVEFKLKKDQFRLATGLNLNLGFNTSKIITNTGENLKQSQVFITYTNPQFVQFQPTVRLSHKRMSVQVSTTFSRNRIGYGATEYRVGKLWYLGIGYKIY